MRSIVRVQSISPRPQFNNFSRDTVPLRKALSAAEYKFMQFISLTAPLFKYIIQGFATDLPIFRTQHSIFYTKINQEMKPEVLIY